MAESELKRLEAEYELIQQKKSKLQAVLNFNFNNRSSFGDVEYVGYDMHGPVSLEENEDG